MTAPGCSVPPDEHCNWVRRMLVWSTALAVSLLLLAWAGMNWKMFHLYYCQRCLLASGQEPDQQKGLMLVEKYHIETGTSLEALRRTIRPLELSESTVPDYPPRPGQPEPRFKCYDVFDRRTGRYPGVMVDIDENSCLARWSWLK